MAKLFTLLQPMRYALALISVLLVLSSDSCSQVEKKVSADPQDYREWFITSGNWQRDPKLYVRTLGTGHDTVIMLHGGWGGEHHSLIESTRGLEDKYLFILYDQRGSLRSPCPDSLISLDSHVNDLELIRKELRVSRLKIIGHSMGAMLAGAYHDKFPNRVKSLTLLAPAYMKEPFSNEAKDIELVKISSQKFETFLERPGVKNELNKLQLLRTDPPLSSIEETSKFRINTAARFLYDVTKWPKLRGGGPFYNPRIGYLVSPTLPPSGWDYYANFKKSKLPVSIVLGDHDFLDMGAAIVRKSTKDASSIEVTVIEKAGHNIWIDQPEKFKLALDHALKK
jgi:proline iminopeptidase